MSKEYKDTILRLKDWIRRSPYKTAEFARLIGMTEHTISWVIHDRKKRQYFTAEQAVSVEQVTSGTILASELLAHAIPEGYELRKIDTEDEDIARIRVMIESQSPEGATV